jgi:hypothetical protein
LSTWKNVLAQCFKNCFICFGLDFIRKFKWQWTEEAIEQVQGHSSGLRCSKEHFHSLSLCVPPKGLLMLGGMENELYLPKKCPNKASGNQALMLAFSWRVFPLMEDVKGETLALQSQNKNALSSGQ